MTATGAVSPPQTLSIKIDSIPQELKAISQWVAWKLLLRDGKWTKPPVDPKTGGTASTTDPKTWVSFNVAMDYHLKNSTPGIGIIPAEKMTVLDLDHCRDLSTGIIEPWAAEIVDTVPAYWEISPSGTGLRAIVWAKKPEGRCRKSNFEIYAGGGGRYVTITGNRLPQSTKDIPESQYAINRLHIKMFPPSKPTTPAGAFGHVDYDNAELLNQMYSWQNGSAIRCLWEGDTSAHGGDDSAADMSLLCHLRFATGGDATRMERMFGESALGRREKWLERPDYRKHSIEAAMALGGEVFTPKSAHSNGHSAGDGDSTKVEGFHLTDLGNAKRLVALHGGDLRYCFPRKAWFVWDKTRWAPDDCGEVYRRAKSAVASIYSEAAKEQDEDHRKALAKWAATSESDKHINAMISQARSEPGIPVMPKDLDTDPWLLNVLNGTIDLRTGRLRRHCRTDLITMLAPVVYKPNTRDVIWESFLDRVLPDSSLQGFVQRAAGYSLTGDCSEEVLFFPYGPTQTGKSTLLKALTRMLGDYSMIADFGAFLARDRNAGGPRNDIATMAGKRLVVSVEVDPGQRLSEALVKQLTGGDDARARFLFQESFEFTPSFKIWLAANDRPHVRDDDAAIWRRILQIPFDEQISEAERDPAIKAHLCDPAAAGPAILAWAVQGCLNWQLLGLGVPGAVRDTTAEYRAEMDPLNDFISDFCIVGPDAQANNTAVWKAYEQWAQDNGVKRPLGRKIFTQRLKNRGFEASKSGTRYWQGIGLLTNGPA